MAGIPYQERPRSALLAQALQRMQEMSRYQPQSWGALAAGLGAQYLNQQSVNQARGQEEASQQATQQALAKALMNAYNKAQGGSAGVIGDVDGGPGTQMQSQYISDPAGARAGIVPQAMSSGLGPEQAMMAVQLFDAAYPKDESKLVEAIGPNGEKVLTRERPGLVTGTPPVPDVVAVETPEGPRYVRKSEAVGKSPVKKDPIVNIDTGDKTDKYYETVGPAIAKSLEEAKAKAEQSRQLIGNLEKMEELAASNTFSGALAPGLTGAVSFARSIGVKVPVDAAKNTAAFRAFSNSQMLEQMALMGGARGFSEKESAILYDAFPKIQDDPAARLAIINVLKSKALENISAYNMQLQESTSRLNDLKSGGFGLPSETVIRRKDGDYVYMNGQWYKREQ